MTKERYDVPVEAKAGKVGVLSVFLFGVLSILVVFVAAYMWTDADSKLAAAIGVASIIIPTTVGFFVSELRHQRAGAFCFVLTAAVLAGGLGAWSIDEREDFENRMDLIAPGAVARIEADATDSDTGLPDATDSEATDSDATDSEATDSDATEVSGS